jgi:hypothetical protein
MTVLDKLDRMLAEDNVSIGTAAYTLSVVPDLIAAVRAAQEIDQAYWPVQSKLRIPLLLMDHLGRGGLADLIRSKYPAQEVGK